MAKSQQKDRYPWRDELSTELIDPEFYAILKENGFPSMRFKDGSYKDKDSQNLWEEWKGQK